MADINRTTVIQSPLGGKGLAAADDILAESLLLRIPNPYILLPDKASLSKICSWCFDDGIPFPKIGPSTSAPKSYPATRPLKKCSGCQVTRYCSTSCQRAHWRSVHRKECVRLALLPDVPPTPVRALMQILLTHPFGTTWDPRWASLQGHIDEMRQTMGERWDNIQLQAKAAIKFSGREDARFEVALAILGRIFCNSFRTILPDSTPSGLCFEPLIALTNHSCEPNSYVAFEGRTVALRSLVPITRGEELLISYIDNDQPKNVRKSSIWETYWFWCQCPRCEVECDDKDTEDPGL
ncbi:hypothetical protein K3495_g10523 [Podosphaera aphanis]|nr:hypothetical protein K3495_g10523 [Podosphaera aphanis]